MSYDIHLSIRPSVCPSMFALSVYYVCILGLYLHMFTMYRYSAYHVYTKLYMVHLGVSVRLSVRPCVLMCTLCMYTVYVCYVCIPCMRTMYGTYAISICLTVYVSICPSLCHSVHPSIPICVLKMHVKLIFGIY